MVPSAAAVPAALPAVGLGTLLGPISVLAVAATAVALAVIVVGVALERREEAARRRIRETVALSRNRAAA